MEMSNQFLWKHMLWTNRPIASIKTRVKDGLKNDKHNVSKKKRKNRKRRKKNNQKKAIQKRNQIKTKRKKT